ncbi:2-dehydro-3-deoxygluconokinase [Striga asiatica]|uniref:2-dehydro-3-deoxygluconokinase n=1 Tax=Striga asiatica TaxID=4170 RepID=A0A5A7Q8K1_STRAF|nr:2-dehydro-3-deoxygluconokinase [Striga asiatica]
MERSDLGGELGPACSEVGPRRPDDRGRVSRFRQSKVRHRGAREIGDSVVKSVVAGGREAWSRRPDDREVTSVKRLGSAIRKRRWQVLELTEVKSGVDGLDFPVCGIGLYDFEVGPMDGEVGFVVKSGLALKRSNPIVVIQRHEPDVGKVGLVYGQRGGSGGSPGGHDGLGEKSSEYVKAGESTHGSGGGALRWGGSSCETNSLAMCCGLDIWLNLGVGQQNVEASAMDSEPKTWLAQGKAYAQNVVIATWGIKADQTKTSGEYMLLGLREWLETWMTGGWNRV